MRRFNTAITGASLAIGMIAGGLLMPPAAHAQRYLVNGHPATAKEEQLLRSYGFAAGAWRMSGWGISPDVEHADTESRLPQCHYVLGVPLDCGERQIASR